MSLVNQMASPEPPPPSSSSSSTTSSAAPVTASASSSSSSSSSASTAPSSVCPPSPTPRLEHSPSGTIISFIQSDSSNQLKSANDVAAKVISPRRQMMEENHAPQKNVLAMAPDFRSKTPPVPTITINAPTSAPPGSPPWTSAAPLIKIDSPPPAASPHFLRSSSLPTPTSAQHTAPMLLQHAVSTGSAVPPRAPTGAPYATSATSAPNTGAYYSGVSSPAKGVSPILLNRPGLISIPTSPAPSAPNSATLTPTSMAAAGFVPLQLDTPEAEAFFHDELSPPENPKPLSRNLGSPNAKLIQIPTATLTGSPVLPPSAISPASKKNSPPQPFHSLSTPSASGSSRKPVYQKVGKYVLVRTLGQGTYGKVKLAYDSDSGKCVAIKIMEKVKIKEKGMADQIKKEIKVMKMLNHESIIQLIEVLMSDTAIFIVLELAAEELFDKILENGKLDDALAREYFHQLIDGISYCHTKGVAHRDLKPENLLLNEQGKLKISDFGLSALSIANTDSNTFGGDMKLMSQTTCGTPHYVAPEVLMEQGYDGFAADIWSAGVILYVMLAGFLPFDEQSLVDLFRKIVKADFLFPGSMSKSAVSLIGGILNPDPEKRITIKQIKEHPWYKGESMANELSPRRLKNSPKGGASPSPKGSVSVPNAANANAHTGSGAGGSPKNDLLAPNAAHLYAPQTPSPASSPGPPAPHHLSAAALHNAASAEHRSSSSTSSSASSSSQGDADGNDADVEDDDDDDDVDASADAPVTAPARPVNAFDLVNMVGSAAVSRMFQKETEKRVRTFTQFPCAVSRDLALSHLQKVLKNSVGVSIVKLVPEFFHLKAQKLSDRGQKIIMAIQLYEMAPKLNMIECRRIRGDTFAYHKWYQELKTAFERLVPRKEAIQPYQHVIPVPAQAVAKDVK